MLIMSEQWANRVVKGGSSHAFRLVIGRSTLGGKLLVIAAMLIIFALLAVIIVPIVVIGVALVVCGIVAGRVRRLFGGMRAPNGVLDERRNVRVIVRE